MILNQNNENINIIHFAGGSYINYENIVQYLNTCKLVLPNDITILTMS